MKYILKKNRNSSNSYVFPKVYMSKKITDEINKSNDICVNMKPPKHLEGKLLQEIQIVLLKVSVVF